MAVLDTTVLVALEKGSTEASDTYLRLSEEGEPVRLPSAAWTEYLSGFDPVDRDEARETLEASVTFEPFTRRLADEAARLQFELMRAGDPLGWHDIQVATTALHYDEPLVSSDERFQAVPGLGLVDH